MPPRALQVVSQTGGAPLLGQQPKAKCTDCPCCVTFVVFLVLTVVLGVFGEKYGHPDVLIRFAYGRDFKGSLCGIDHDVKNYKLTYFTLKDGSLPVAGLQWTSAMRSQLRPVCTSKCPQSTKNGTAHPTKEREPDLCAPEMHPNWCTWYGGNTTRIANYCIDIGVFNVQSNWKHAFEDVRSSALLLALAPALAIVLGFTFLWCIYRFGAVIIGISLLAVVLLPAGLGTWIYFRADNALTHGGNGSEPGRFSPERQKEVAYGIWALAGALVLLLVCFMGTVKNVIAVMKATSQFLRDVPSQMILPVLIGALQLIVFVIWLFPFVSVASIGAAEGNLTKCLEVGDAYCVSWDTHSQFLVLVFLVFMLFWLLNFLHALSHFGTAYAVAAWYFARPNVLTGQKEPAEGGHSLCDCRLSLRAIGNGLLYHSGSLAMGAFFISGAKLAKMLIFWATKVDHSEVTNPAIKCIKSCVNCLADCLEKFVNFMSEHAYVELALQGTPFCSSAQKAASIILTRPGLFVLVGRVACAIRFLGVAVVAASTTYIVGLIFVFFPPVGVTSANAPLVLAFLVAFFIGEVMMHPFAAAARAALHCFCLDEELARTRGMQSPEHTPQAMLRFIEEHGDQEPRKCCCF